MAQTLAAVGLSRGAISIDLNSCIDRSDVAMVRYMARFCRAAPAAPVKALPANDASETPTKTLAKTAGSLLLMAFNTAATSSTGASQTNGTYRAHHDSGKTIDAPKSTMPIDAIARLWPAIS